MTRLIHVLANLKLFWFLVWFTLSAASLLSWEMLLLVTTPISHRWRLRRRIAPVAISTTAITIVLMTVRFAHFAKLI